MLNRLVLSVLVLAACTSIAACSSNGTPGSPGVTTPLSSPSGSAPLSAAAYTRLLKQIAAEESRAQHAVQAAFHARTAAQVRSALTAFARDQQQVADELNSTVPPPNAQAANSALAHAFADNAAATRHVAQQTARAATAKAALRIIQGATNAQRSGREIDAALARLRKLGYTAGS